MPDSVFSKFFRYGQVIETFRGRGVFQPAIDDAIEKLNRGEWVRASFPPHVVFHAPHIVRAQIHLFSEGKVNPDACDPNSPQFGKLLRFKWGV